jgi:hypothetical protein
MKCTRIGEKTCNCLCFEIDQEMDAILLIIDIVNRICRIVIKSVQQCRYFLFFVNLLLELTLTLINVSLLWFTVSVDLTEPVPGELIDGVQNHFTDLQFSPSPAKVGAQWKDYKDPESGISQYDLQVLIAR